MISFDTKFNVLGQYGWSTWSWHKYKFFRYFTKTDDLQILKMDSQSLAINSQTFGVKILISNCKWVGTTSQTLMLFYKQFNLLNYISFIYYALKWNFQIIWLIYAERDYQDYTIYANLHEYSTMTYILPMVITNEQ